MITHTEKHTYKHIHSWIFNGIEMYLNMRSSVITWHYSFSRVLNNISVAGKPFVSSYQGFWVRKKEKDSIFTFICGQHLNHTKPSNIMSYISHQSKNHWKAHNMTYKEYYQVFLNLLIRCDLVHQKFKV